MPITYTVMKNGGILFKGKGFVSGNEIKEINDAIYGSPKNILKIKYQLWDLTNISEILVSNEDIEAFAYHEAAAKINSNMIIAIVASKDIIFGLSRM